MAFKDEAEYDADRIVYRYPFFWCEHCGKGPYRYPHYVMWNGLRKKYCHECWIDSLPDR